MAHSLKTTLTELYTGSQKRSQRFRLGLIAFDAITIILFIALAPFEPSPRMELFGFGIGLVILMDFSARLWIAQDRRAMLLKIYTLADIVVILSLLISPFIHANLAFLRVLRGLRIIHSYHLLRDLRHTSAFFAKHEDAVIAAVNLFVFIFFTTSIVFALFAERSAGVRGYIDALYFTVTTLTTTGYGDITPTTTGGKLLAVVIMVVGVALFVQLARAIIQPSKVSHKCGSCGLMKHDHDAVHCKHCGEVIRIETQGWV
ncbi:MAG: ion channel [Paracoccaceae bacterium]|nr:ion channel [Paracoccaceae bacterium]